jgi:hypothetical protein
MEFLLDLIPALVIFWFVLRGIRGSGRRRTRRQGAQPRGSQAATSESRPSGFEELVRRLEQAAAEAQQRQVVVVPPAPAVRFEPPPIPQAQDEFAFRNSESTDAEFRYIGGIDEGYQATEFHETHALDAPYAPSKPIGTGRHAAGVHPLVARLRTPSSALEALLLKDVLSAPRSRSRSRR